MFGPKVPEVPLLLEGANGVLPYLQRVVARRGPSGPALFASRPVRRALLTSQANPGSRYRCSRST